MSSAPCHSKDANVRDTGDDTNWNIEVHSESVLKNHGARERGVISPRVIIGGKY